MKIPIITGATSSGKSAVVYRFLEERPEYEFISADAFQVYRGLNIGTAKPDPAILKRFPHHLVNILEPGESYSAGRFVEHAEQAIAKIIGNGKKPIVAGGTGLYIESLRNGLFNEPSIDPLMRKALLTLPKEELYAELSQVDPESAVKINSNDKIRLVRALEVWKSLGIPLSAARKLFKGEARFKYNVYILDKQRDILYRDINGRCEKMLQAGWLEEVKCLLSLGVAPDAPAFRAIGYRELAAVAANQMTIDMAKELISQKTRNFAKRQLTWFRRMKDTLVLSADGILKHLAAGG
jgi:tRNA dimethylallyltransferase